MNSKFMAMSADIDTLRMDIAGMRHVADSLATCSFRLSIQVQKLNKTNQQAGALFFSFWGAFVSYLHFFK